jgi:uncharacterized protein DUF1259
MGIASYAAFMKVGAQTMVMGDTTLLEDQVNPVMTVALDGGLEVTALHNHFSGIRPMFMHIGGVGDEEKLAAAMPWASTPGPRLLKAINKRWSMVTL